MAFGRTRSEVSKCDQQTGLAVGLVYQAPAAPPYLVVSVAHYVAELARFPLHFWYFSRALPPSVKPSVVEAERCGPTNITPSVVADNVDATFSA